MTDEQDNTTVSQADKTTSTPTDGATQETAQTPPADVSLVPASQLEAAERQVEELRSLLQRERADFVNYRRRAESERAQLVQSARAEGLLSILPLLDNLERAAAGVPAELRDQPWVKGVLLVADQLASALQSAGLERFGAPGDPFNPRLHEAFLNQEHPDIPAGHVSLVLRAGYKMGDRVLRAAQVAVSDGAATSITEEKQQQDSSAKPEESAESESP
ncbi:MAG: nucleotide exchange factor GrpE [Chloroflexi bacterium]|nr:nucleotide exchange factor GrpE [Chloroflexota bacterium]